MPTRETRTHASMTIPLSSTRSRTSIRLVPPGARSTGIDYYSFCRLSQCRSAPPHQRGELPFQRPHLLFQFVVLRRERLLAWGKMMIELPPVETNLFGLVDRAHQQPDADGEELDFRQRDLDVARNDEAFVQDAIQDINKARRSGVPITQWRRHSWRILVRTQFSV